MTRILVNRKNCFRLEHRWNESEMFTPFRKEFVVEEGDDGLELYVDGVPVSVIQCEKLINWLSEARCQLITEGGR